MTGTITAERWIATRPRNAPMPTESAQAFITASRQAHKRRRNLVLMSPVKNEDVIVRPARRVASNYAD